MVTVRYSASAAGVGSAFLRREVGFLGVGSSVAAAGSSAGVGASAVGASVAAAGSAAVGSGCFVP